DPRAAHARAAAERRRHARARAALGRHRARRRPHRRPRPRPRRRCREVGGALGERLSCGARVDWQLSDDAQPAARVPAARLVEAQPDARPVPVTGAWRPGDDPGERRFARIGDVETESGGTIPDAVLAFETWGRLDERAGNAVLVLHALA